MTGKRSKPLLIAPAIPLLGLLGLFGIERFGGTRLLPAFVVLWSLVFAALLTYVFRNLLQARLRRRPRKGA